MKDIFNKSTISILSEYCEGVIEEQTQEEDYQTCLELKDYLDNIPTINFSINYNPTNVPVLAEECVGGYEYFIDINDISRLQESTGMDIEEAYIAIGEAKGLDLSNTYIMIDPMDDLVSSLDEASAGIRKKIVNKFKKLKNVGVKLVCKKKKCKK